MGDGALHVRPLTLLVRVVWSGMIGCLATASGCNPCDIPRSAYVPVFEEVRVSGQPHHPEGALEVLAFGAIPGEHEGAALVEAPATFAGRVSIGFRAAFEAPSCTPSEPAREVCGMLWCWIVLAGPQRADEELPLGLLTHPTDVAPGAAGAYLSYREYPAEGGSMARTSATRLEGSVTVVSTEPLVHEYRVTFWDDRAGTMSVLSTRSRFERVDECLVKRTR
jgi:hypothetical protein